MDFVDTSSFLPLPAGMTLTFPVNGESATLTLPIDSTGLSSYPLDVELDGQDLDLSTYVQTGTTTSISFLTPVDGIYKVKLSEGIFYIPILGRILCCRQDLCREALPCGCCPKELDKTLRTLDCLLRSLYSCIGIGDWQAAKALFSLLAPLCETCNCGCA